MSVKLLKLFLVYICLNKCGNQMYYLISHITIINSKCYVQHLYITVYKVIDIFYIELIMYYFLRVLH